METPARFSIPAREHGWQTAVLCWLLGVPLAGIGLYWAISDRHLDFEKIKVVLISAVLCFTLIVGGFVALRRQRHGLEITVDRTGIKQAAMRALRWADVARIGVSPKGYIVIHIREGRGYQRPTYFIGPFPDGNTLSEVMAAIAYMRADPDEARSAFASGSDDRTV